MRCSPFPEPVPEQLLPKVSEVDPEQDGRVIRWFVGTENNYSIESQLPLARWLRNLDNYRLSKPLEAATPGPPENDKSESAETLRRLIAEASVFDLYEAQRLAWSIRVLAGKRHHRQTQIDASVVRDELRAPPKADGRIFMPGGTGTLYQAARLMQVGGGKIHVFGVKSEGVDIEWRPAEGGVACIERKDRLYETSVGGDLTSWLQHFASQIGKAAPKLAKRWPAARIISVGYAGRPELTGAMRAKTLELVEGLVASSRVLLPANCPDAMYGAFIGYGVESGLDAVDHGHFVEITGRRERQCPHWRILRPLFQRAYDHRFR